MTQNFRKPKQAKSEEILKSSHTITSYYNPKHLGKIFLRGKQNQIFKTQLLPRFPIHLILPTTNSDTKNKPK